MSRTLAEPVMAWQPVPRSHETDHAQTPQVPGEQAEALRIVHEQQAAALVELTQQVVLAAWTRTETRKQMGSAA